MAGSLIQQLLAQLAKPAGAAGAAAAVGAPGAGLSAALGTAGIDAATVGMTKLQAVIDSLTKSFENFDSTASKMGKALGTGGSWFESFANIATKMQEAGADVQRATGQVDKLSAAWGGAGFGMSMKEASKSIGELHNNFIGFEELSKDSMKTISKQAMGFTRLGIAIQDTGKNYTLMSKALQMTEKDMKKTQDKIAKSALALGIAPKKMAADYNKIIPQLMHWGKQSTGVFLKLAANAKATGVEMDSLLKVAAGFDEFESAAEKTGKLNMLLGGPYLNTVQMIRADEAERIDLLKQSIALTGKSVDQLGRWRVRDISKEMGFKDLADFYKAMGAPQSVIDKYKKKLSPAELAQINLNKAIGKGVKISEVWAAWFEKISAIIGGPFLKVMGRFARFMMSGEGGKGITQVFGWFADGINRVLDLWDNMDPAMKKQIEKMGIFLVKMIATSAAVKGFQEVLSPVLSLLTNPSSGLIAAVTWLITNWEGWTLTIEKARTQFQNLDTTIKDWLRNMSNDETWGAIFGPLSELYTYISEDIMGAMLELQTTDWDTKYKEFILYLKEQFVVISDFFSHISTESKKAGGGFSGLIKALKNEAMAFINDIAIEIEQMVMKRYGRQISQYLGVEKTKGNIAEGALGFLGMGSPGISGGISAAESAQMGIAFRGVGFKGEGGHRMSSAELLPDFMRKLTKFRSEGMQPMLGDIKRSEMGKAVERERLRFGRLSFSKQSQVGIPANLIQDEEQFWKSVNIQQFMEAMASSRVGKLHNGGKSSIFGKAAPFAMAPGETLVLPDQYGQVKSESQSSQGGSSAPTKIEIWMESEKVGEGIGRNGIGFGRGVDFKYA